MSSSALSSSISLVKQWQCIIGMESSYTPLMSLPPRQAGDKTPRNASKNVMAESGRFITKCDIRRRGGRAGLVVACGGDTSKLSACCLRSFCNCLTLGCGPLYAGKGLSSDWITTARMKSRPSSQVTHTRSVTYKQTLENTLKKAKGAIARLPDYQ
jgi:hypothetical protein